MNQQPDTGAQSATPSTFPTFTGSARTVMDGVQNTGIRGLVLWGMQQTTEPDGDTEVIGTVFGDDALKPGVPFSFADIPEVTDGDTHSYMMAVATGHNLMAVVSYIGDDINMEDIASSTERIVVQGDLAMVTADANIDYIPNTVHMVGPKGTVKIAVVDLEAERAVPVNMDNLLSDYDAEDYWLTMGYGGDLIILLETSTDSGTIMSISGSKLRDMVRGQQVVLNPMSVRGQVKITNDEYLLRTGKPGQNSEVVVNIVTADGKLKVQTYKVEHALTLRDVKIPDQEFVIDNSAIGVPDNYACMGIGALSNTLGFMDEEGSYMCVPIDAAPILADVAKIWKAETTDDAINNEGLDTWHSFHDSAGDRVNDDNNVGAPAEDDTQG